MSGLLQALLPVLPLLLLLTALVLGRYPGCEAIVRLSERIASRGRPTPKARKTRRPAMPPLFAPSGGLLIAISRAQRPPPLAP